VIFIFIFLLHSISLSGPSSGLVPYRPVDLFTLTPFFGCSCSSPVSSIRCRGEGVLPFTSYWWIWSVLVTAILLDLLFCQMLALVPFLGQFSLLLVQLKPTLWFGQLGQKLPQRCLFVLPWDFVARVSVASVCRSPASSFSVADFCSSVLLIHASCCQLSRVLVSHGGSSLSRTINVSLPDRFPVSWTGRLMKIFNFLLRFFIFRRLTPGAWREDSVFFFRGSPPGSVISGAIKPCSPRVSSAKRGAPKLFPRWFAESNFSSVYKSLPQSWFSGCGFDHRSCSLALA
jgi:hypothetical protein